MALIISRPPCFRRFGWRQADTSLFLWFSDGRKYRVGNALEQDFTAIDNALKHGTVYNLDVRGMRALAVRIITWPTDLDLEGLGGA